MALAGLLVLVAVGLPLVVRGPVLAHLVEHQSKDLCGTVSLKGGHVSLGLALALIRQRPFDVAFDGVVVREPEGDDLFRAGAVRARVNVLRRPWRVEIERASVVDGAMGLLDRGLKRQITVAFRPVPPGGRTQCRAPTPPSTRPPRQGDVVTVRSLTLKDFTVGLSFPAWAVVLRSVDAHGSLQVRGTASGQQFLFDARDIIAKQGGGLRVGPLGSRLTPKVPFDRVSIPRVAVVESAPQNLLLEVQEGRTEQAVLSGQALFTNIFPSGPRRAPAGMEIDARWTELGLALGRNPAWAAVGKHLARLNTGLHASLRGPFAALTGKAALIGKGASLEARLLANHRYELDAQFDQLDTTPLLPRSRRAQLGGLLDGQIAVRAKLGRTAKEMSVSVDRLELGLLRSHPADGPRRLVVSRVAAPSSAKDLRIGLGRITLEREVLRVESVRVRGPGVQVATSLRAEREDGSRVLLVQAATTADSRLAVRGETFVLPPRLRVRFDPGRLLAIEPFSIRHAGGGAIDVGGSLRFDGSADLHAAVHDYPIARIPGLAGSRARLRGRLDASFRVAGSTKQPNLSGVLTLTGLGWAERLLGDSRIVFHAIDGGTRFEGALIDGLDVQGQVRLQPGRRTARLRGRADLRPLQPLLAPLHLRQAAGVIAADVRWEAAGKATPQISGTIEVLERLSIWPDRLPGAVGVPPTRIELTGDEIRVPRLVVLVRGGQATVTGRMHGIDWNQPAGGTLEGTLMVNAEGGGFGRWLGAEAAGSGAARFNGELTGSVAAPHVKGQAQFDGLTVDWPKSPSGAVRLDGPLTIDGQKLDVGPLMFRFANGGWIKVAGRQGSGRLTLQPGRTPLPVTDVDLTVQGGGLTTVRPLAGLSVTDLALDVRLAEVGEDRLRLAGDVRLGQLAYDLRRAKDGKDTKQDKAAPSRRPSETRGALDRVSVDLRLTGPRDAIKVRVPYAPDVTVGLNCLVQGLLTSPHMIGEVKGSGAYSRVALAAADRFSDRDLRRCDFGPR